MRSVPVHAGATGAARPTLGHRLTGAVGARAARPARRKAFLVRFPNPDRPTSAPLAHPPRNHRSCMAIRRRVLRRAHAPRRFNGGTVSRAQIRSTRILTYIPTMTACTLAIHHVPAGNTVSRTPVRHRAIAAS